MSNKANNHHSTLNGQVNIDLLIRCQEGNRMAQMELYRLLSKRVYNTCLRIVKNRETAEDMMQETFIRVFNGISKFEGRSQLLTWIKRIAINQCLNEVSRNKIVHVEAQEWNVVEVEDETPDPKYDVKQLKVLMMELPQGYRIILSLHLLEGYTHEEIAEILKIKASTSRSQYLRGKKKLKMAYLEWQTAKTL